MGQSAIERVISTRVFDTSFKFSQDEIRVLRDLAKKVAECAARPEMAHKAKLWTDHNALRKTRPLLFCDPENGWNEILPQSVMQTRDPAARYWEMRLRREIFWADVMGDDYVVEPWFDVPWDYHDSKWGIAQKLIGGENGGAYRWDPPIKDFEADFPKLVFPTIDIDRERSRRFLDLANELFGDILQVRRKTVWWWGVGLSAQFSDLRGLDAFMIDLYDNPEWIHRTMAFLRDGMLAKMSYLEDQGLLSSHQGNTYVGSGGLGWSDELPPEGHDPDRIKLMDIWGNAESQETVSVSPAMFEEFVFQYQLPLMERFGLNCYGCCESLEDRMHIVKRIPRLRRVSVCPWADVRKMADEIRTDYIYSWKPNPAQLAVPAADIDASRRMLRDMLGAAEGCRIEIVMKDNHSIGNNVDNVVKWCRMVMEEVSGL
jgi:hypothetical protein